MSRKQLQFSSENQYSGAPPVSEGYSDSIVQFMAPPPGFEVFESPPPAVPVREEKPKPKAAPEEAWVTVKAKPKNKKGKGPVLFAESDTPTTAQKQPEAFENLAQYQLSSSISKKRKNLKKKLKEISALEAKQSRGVPLSPRSIARLNNKEKLENDLRHLPK